MGLLAAVTETVDSARRGGPMTGTGRGGALPTLVVIGAMKCGTTALHAHLGRHPDIAMAPGKELNFFLGPDEPPPAPEDEWWRHGQWHRGLDWYAAQFDAGARVRGEASPGYTDPSHPEVVDRMRRVLPDARLVYLVRDPVDRAASQWAHHVRDGTEPRPVGEAVLDPASQYLARSRYVERLQPFLAAYPREQLLVVVQERLKADPRRELARVFAHAGADPGFWDDALTAEVHAGGDRTDVPPEVRETFWAAVADDVARLRGLLGDDLAEWGTTARQPEGVSPGA